MNQPAQIDLFDLLAAARAVTVSLSAEDVHWVVVTPRRAMTACGTVVTAMDWKSGQWLAESGAAVTCSLDLYSGKVTCNRCREVL